MELTLSKHSHTTTINTSNESACKFRSSVSISLGGYTKTEHLALVCCSASNVLVQYLPWHLTCVLVSCAVLEPLVSAMFGCPSAGWPLLALGEGKVLYQWFGSSYAGVREKLVLLAICCVFWIGFFVSDCWFW